MIGLAMIAAIGTTAAATPLLRAADDSVVAVSGGDVLVGGSSPSGRAVVRAIPAVGGAPVVRFRGAPPRRGRVGRVNTLSASNERVAFIVSDRDRSDDGGSTLTALVGPVSGPYVELASGRLGESMVPLDVQADGERVLLVESDLKRTVATVVEADGSRTPVPLPGSSFPVKLAGDLIATLSDGPETDPGLEPERRLRLLDRRTGAERPIVTPPGVDAFALRADGLVVAAGEGARATSRLFAIEPGAQPRALGAGVELAGIDRGLEELTLAGDAVLARQRVGGDPAVAERPAAVPIAGGRPLVAGPNTTAVHAAAIGDRWIAWVANSCVAAVARAALPAPGSLGPGPCPRAELTIEDVSGQPRSYSRSVGAQIGCLTAPRDRCEVLIRALVDPERGPRVTVARRRVRVPVGPRRLVRMPVTRRGLRALRAAARRESDGIAFLTIVATVIDPGGRSSTVEQGSITCPDRCRSPI